MEKFAQKVTHWLGTPASLAFHTVFFFGMLLWCILDKKDRETLLLIFTLAVSLEAIYQMIFLQMTANKQGKELTEVKSTVAEVHESVETVQEAVETVQETVGEVQETMTEVQETVVDIHEDVSEEETSASSAELTTTSK